MLEELDNNIQHHIELADLRKANERLEQALRKAKQKQEALADAVLEAAYDAVITHWPIQKIPKPPRDPKINGAEAALWVLTDWQGAKRTTTYNSQVMRERVMRYTEKAINITNIQRQHHRVGHCTIAFGGDMVEGLFNFPTQPFEIDQTLFEQFVTVSRLIVDVVSAALANYETVEVVAEWGNHGRIGNKHQAVPKNDNIDRMCYELARQLLAGEKRLKWNDSAEDIQQIEIGNYRALLMHGDEVGRSGFASPSAWQAAGNRWRSGAYKWQFQDIYLGHYHRHAQEPLADGLGTIYWTGSTESDNKYARDNLASAGIPSQRLHFIDPQKGRVTAVYQVWLDDK